MLKIISRSRLLFARLNRSNVIVALVVVITIAVTGSFLILTKAAGIVVVTETESGTKSALAKQVADTTASSGQAVKFTRAAPPATGYPDATNTGYAAAGYSNLTPHAGGWNINASGVYSGYNVSGTVTISASNVTLKGCNIHGSTDTHLITITGDNVNIEDCDVHGDGPTTAQSPETSWIQVLSDGVTIKRCNFYNSSGDGIRRDGNNFTIMDSYLHDWVPHPTNQPHSDGISEGFDGATDSITIVHNTVLMYSDYGLTNVVSFAAGPGNAMTNVLVQNNLLAGGGYIFHGGGDTNYNNMTFSGNVIGTQFFSDGGDYGVMRNPPVWGTKGTSWTNNKWYDGPRAGQLIPAP